MSGLEAYRLAANLLFLNPVPYRDPLLAMPVLLFLL